MNQIILIVDDDEELADELKNILTDVGYSVVTLTSTTFTQVIDTISPDLVLLDVWFDSNKSGIIMAQALHANQKLNGIPILLMSSDPEIKNYALEAKVANYVQKPIDIPQLLSTVNTLLN